MGDAIKKLTIEGFKSIQKLEDFELRSLNVLIGANGAGKSNFVAFFRLLRELIEQRLQRFAATEGGADACLYMGPKITKRLVAKLYFGANGYEFELLPAADNRLIFSDEPTDFSGQFKDHIRRSLGSGHSEPKLKDRKDDPCETARQGVPYYVFDAVSSWIVYHFHDSSPTAGGRLLGPINDHHTL